MTHQQAQQINAHMTLTSAFFHSKDSNACMKILNARQELAAEMDAVSLLTAINLSSQMDYFTRVA
jgi:hypothetical protein